MAECKKNVGKGVIAYPCYLPTEHDGPCVARENTPSQHARRAWLAATEAEALAALEETVEVLEPAYLRQVPHPGAEPLSAFQGPARTSVTGLMEHEEEGIASPAPLSTVDTNAPGQGRTIRAGRPRTIWAGEPVAVNPPPPIEEAVVPTKTRPGDQPLPVVNDTPFIQDLVIEDFEARKAVGVQRYGTPLQAFNGRNVDQDLYEELIDATTYLRQKLIERQALNDAVVGLTRLLEEHVTLSDQAWAYLDLLYAGTKSG